ncbi:MAG: hypothetical protein HYZ73_03060, partial [Elusimicrobia bacterium]|nr:hypothetical protein [Elusimicrobiota bacterium]
MRVKATEEQQTGLEELATALKRAARDAGLLSREPRQTSAAGLEELTEDEEMLLMEAADRSYNSKLCWLNQAWTPARWVVESNYIDQAMGVYGQGPRANPIRAREAGQVSRALSQYQGSYFNGWSVVADELIQWQGAVHSPHTGWIYIGAEAMAEANAELILAIILREDLGPIQEWAKERWRPPVIVSKPAPPSTAKPPGQSERTIPSAVLPEPAPGRVAAPPPAPAAAPEKPPLYEQVEQEVDPADFRRDLARIVPRLLAGDLTFPRLITTGYSPLGRMSSGSVNLSGLDQDRFFALLQLPRNPGESAPFAPIIPPQAIQGATDRYLYEVKLYDDPPWKPPKTPRDKLFENLDRRMQEAKSRLAIPPGEVLPRFDVRKRQVEELASAAYKILESKEKEGNGSTQWEGLKKKYPEAPATLEAVRRMLDQQVFDFAEVNKALRTLQKRRVGDKIPAKVVRQAYDRLIQAWADWLPARSILQSYLRFLPAQEEELVDLAPFSGILENLLVEACRSRAFPLLEEGSAKVLQEGFNDMAQVALGGRIRRLKEEFEQGDDDGRIGWDFLETLGALFFV